MKNSPLTTFLLGVLAFSAVSSLVLCWRYNHNTLEMRQMNSQVAFMQDKTRRAQGLLSETVEYAKRNPKMEAVLDSLGIKLVKTNAPAAR